MKQLILYSAVSLDGYIADAKGSVDWLDNYQDAQYDYEGFMEKIDTVLLGNSTYKQILTFREWPYSKQTSYVFSKKLEGKIQHASYAKGEPLTFVEKLKSGKGKDIWLVGGGKLNNTLQPIIDRMILYVIPITLGKGIRLFEGEQTAQKWQLMQEHRFDNGVLEVQYVPMA